MGKIDEAARFVGNKIKYLSDSEKQLNTGISKARLAQLRRGIGKKPGELSELWGFFLQDLPEELMRKDGEPSYAEWAIYTSLTIFALHQQGSRSESMNAPGEENRLGCAVRRLVHTDDDEERVGFKLRLVADSDDMAELSYRLRNVVQLLRSENIKLDYVDLAKDLYNFQFADSADEIRLKWGRDFYRNIKANNRKEENNEEE